ncbi:MAG: OmpA family protein [Bacteroidetes bacterium]|nr:OmpA family protein [Bacteroidota bacterium]
MKTKAWMLLLALFAGFSALSQEDKTASKFDFIPGGQIIYYDDFTSTNVGDFPLEWNTSGSGEVVTYPKYPGQWLQLTKSGYFFPEVKDKFTDNFTVEFDFVPLLNVRSEFMYGLDLYVTSGSPDNPNEGGAIPGKAGIRITIGYDQLLWTNYSEKTEGYKDKGTSSFQFKPGQLYKMAIWIQKQRIRMYVDQNKVLDLPRGLIDGYTYNIFRMENSDEATPLLGKVRIAAGLPDMRTKLLSQGKFISYGIQFDVNSSTLRPESSTTLKELAQIMTDNPALKIKIVGYTDSDGADAFNLDLSKKRANAVMEELIRNYKIDATRLTSDGKGKAEPVAPNDTAVNKARNRRVEFVKVS